MSAPAPPFVRGMARALRQPSQAKPNVFEVFNLEDLQWSPSMKAAELRRVLEARRIPIPDGARRADMIRMLEEHDESQPKSVMAALNR